MAKTSLTSQLGVSPRKRLETHNQRFTVRVSGHHYGVSGIFFVLRMNNINTKNAAACFNCMRVDMAQPGPFPLSVLWHCGRRFALCWGVAGRTVWPQAGPCNCAAGCCRGWGAAGQPAKLQRAAAARARRAGGGWDGDGGLGIGKGPLAWCQWPLGSRFRSGSLLLNVAAYSAAARLAW